MTSRTPDTHRSDLAQVIKDILQPTQLLLILVVGSTVTLGTYGHVITELAGAEKIPAEEQIWQARRAIRPISAHEPRSAPTPTLP
jgi:hypothetical protein